MVAPLSLWTSSRTPDARVCSACWCVHGAAMQVDAHVQRWRLRGLGAGRGRPVPGGHPRHPADAQAGRHLAEADGQRVGIQQQQPVGSVMVAADSVAALMMVVKYSALPSPHSRALSLQAHEHAQRGHHGRERH